MEGLIITIAETDIIPIRTRIAIRITNIDVIRTTTTTITIAIAIIAIITTTTTTIRETKLLMFFFFLIELITILNRIFFLSLNKNF